VVGVGHDLEFTAAHQHDVAVIEDIAFPQPPQFHGAIIAGATDSAVPSGPSH